MRQQHYPFNPFFDSCGITMFGVVTMALCFMTILFGGIFALAIAVESHECAVLQGRYHRHTHYAGIFSGGCYVKIGPHQEIPAENLNGFKSVQ